MAIHVSAEGLGFAELEGTKPALIDLPSIIFFLLSAAFLFPVASCIFYQFQNNILDLFFNPYFYIFQP